MITVSDFNLHETWRDQGETRLVRLTLTRLGLISMLDAVTEASDGFDARMPGRLTFEGLHACLPSLPMRFASPLLTHYARVSPPQIADLLVRPDRATMVRRHAALRGELNVPDDRPLGLVFRYGGVHGGLVLHDGAINMFGTGHRLVTDAGELVVARFRDVLDHIAAGCATGAAGLLEPVSSEEVFDPGLPIPRRVRRVLGCGVVAQVFALLEQLGSRRLRGGLARCAYWHEGLRWARVEEAVMAQWIGCSTSAVKRAVAELVCKGCVVRVHLLVGNIYRAIGPVGNGQTQEANA